TVHRRPQRPRGGRDHRRRSTHLLGLDRPQRFGDRRRGRRGGGLPRPTALRTPLAAYGHGHSRENPRGVRGGSGHARGQSGEVPSQRHAVPRRTAPTRHTVTTHDTTPAPLEDILDPGWARALAPVEPTIRRMGDFLRGENDAGRGYLPGPDRVLRAFTQPFDEVRVLIVGQDPYPTPGHAVGLSFAVDGHVSPLPRSLTNIYREYQDDLGLPAPPHGDLSAWTDAGVLLLNRVLTVTPGAPASHRRRGWEEVTQRAIEALVERDRPMVAVLWGRDAQSLQP